jgi:hypothetical protein
MREADIPVIWHYLLEQDGLRKQLAAEGAVVRRSDRAGRSRNRRLVPSEEVNLEDYEDCILLISIPCSVVKAIQETLRSSAAHPAETGEMNP